MERSCAATSRLCQPIHLLSGIAPILAVSCRIRCAIRSSSSKFAWGVALGCRSVLLLPSLRARSTISAFSAWQLHAAVQVHYACFVLLMRFGSGPGGNDAKRELGPFQLVEAIKILLVFFLAGYFARNWERLRDIRQKSAC